MATYRGKRYSPDRNPYNNAELLKVRKRVFPEGSPWPWVIAISTFILALTIGSFVLNLAVSVDTVMGDANQAMNSVSTFLTAAKTGDQELLKQSAKGLSDAAHDIENELDHGVWEFSARLPYIGSDVQSIRTLAEVFIDFSDNALIPMAESGNILALKDFAKDDSIDFSAMQPLLNAVDEVIPALNRTARTVESLPRANIPQLARVMDNVTEKIVTVDNFVSRIRPLFPYLPDLFGADGRPRNYLILAQNNAEIHALGGFVGSLGILTIENGKISMGDFSNLRDVLSAGDDSSGATQEEIDVFTVRCDTHHGDHNIIPDFSRVGQLYFNIWNRYHDFEVDGVLGLDPVFLQYLIDSFGPIETSMGVTVDGTDCAAVMLNQSLFWWSPDECDVFYRDVANTALKRLLGNLDDVDFTKFLTAVAKAGDENRCLFWSRDESVEDAAKQAGFGGEIKHDAMSPELGVYVSDASTSKMSYYLSCDVNSEKRQDNSDGSATYDVEVTITNNFDPDARDYFPGYVSVVAEGLGKRSDCDLFEDVRILGPEGGSISNLTTERVNTREGTPGDSDWVKKSYQGVDAMCASVRLDAKESVVIRFEVTTSTNVLDDLVIRKTPFMPEDIAYWNVDISEQHPEWNLVKTV